MTSTHKSRHQRHTNSKPSGNQTPKGLSPVTPGSIIEPVHTRGKRIPEMQAGDATPTTRTDGKRKSKTNIARDRNSAQRSHTSGKASQAKWTKPSRTAKETGKSPGPISKTTNVANNALSPKVAAGGKQTVVLGNGTRISISGLRDENGARFIHIRQGGRIAVTRYEAWHGNAAEGSAAMRAGGIIIVSGMGSIREAVDKIKLFPRARIVSRPGWSKHGFALPDGRVLVAKAQPQPLVAFTPATGMLGKGGTLADWIERVARPLADHKLASFLMMTMFASPLLRWNNRADNIGFEISGAPGTGKSTFQFLMASAAGPAIGSEYYTYWRSLNTTLNALETILESYNDLPLILDEAGLVPGAGKPEARAAVMRELAFRLSAGQVKHRFGETAGPHSRLLYVISTNQPIASLLGPVHAAERDAIADRLITLPLLEDRSHGVFDSCPPAFESTGSFVETLKQAAAKHFGHAVPAFLRYLVNEAERRPTALQRRINRYMAAFIARSRTDTNDGSQLRVAEAIGLVYAGGRLAKAAGVLPDNYRCGNAALAALELHRSQVRNAISFDDRLLTLIRNPDTVDLTKRKINSLDEIPRSSCSIFLYTGRSGRRELLVPIKVINRVFPGWRALSHDQEVRQRLDRPKGRAVRDRPVGRNGRLAPVYCFDVTDLV